MHKGNKTKIAHSFAVNVQIGDQTVYREFTITLTALTKYINESRDIASKAFVVFIHGWYYVVPSVRPSVRPSVHLLTFHDRSITLKPFKIFS